MTKIEKPLEEMTLEGMLKQLININVGTPIPIITPEKLKAELPITRESALTTLKSRRAQQKILNREDNRFIMIAGPCSIHNYQGGIEFAEKYREITKPFEDVFLFLNRTYFEKPRTSLGWKGLIFDPNLDGSYDIETGLRTARKLGLEITKMEVPTGTEFLDKLVPQYIDDLISWAAIGARTTESQPHREMASGLSMPVGFKNSTSGDIEAAMNAIKASRGEQTFLGATSDGRYAKLPTLGNENTHIIVRGGNGKPHCNPDELPCAIELLEQSGAAPSLVKYLKGQNGPNYTPEYIEQTTTLLEQAGLVPNIMVDCSHGNSRKDYKRQPGVLYNVLEQRISNPNLIGAMMEVNLIEGSQEFKYLQTDPRTLNPHQSITDAGISLKTFKQVLERGAEILAS